MIDSGKQYLWINNKQEADVRVTVCLLFTSPLAREQDKADKIRLEF